MATAERTARVVWKGDLAHGSGSVRVDSGAFPEFPVTWASRTERSEGKTSPEELIAAAHASCFSMELSSLLAKAGHAPQELVVSARCTLERGSAAPTITTMDLDVVGKVDGMDEAEFKTLAEGARVGCPVSRALTGLEIRLTARLAGGQESGRA